MGSELVPLPLEMPKLIRHGREVYTELSGVLVCSCLGEHSARFIVEACNSHTAPSAPAPCECEKLREVYDFAVKAAERALTYHEDKTWWAGYSAGCSAISAFIKFDLPAAEQGEGGAE